MLLHENHITFTAAQAVNALCEPLNSQGITYCSFVRIFDDGSRFDMNNHPAVTAMYYNHDHYKTYTPEIHPELLAEGFSFISTQYQGNPLIGLLKTEFQLDHLLAHVKRFHGYYEIWHLASTPQNADIVNFYLNQTDFLKRFFISFKNANDDLIRRFTAHRIFTNEQNKVSVIDSVASKKSTPTDRHYFTINNKVRYLTQREMDCLQLFSKGHTAKEIALLLTLSKRTVDTYLDNTKQKMDCTKLSALLVKAIHCGLISY